MWRMLGISNSKKSLLMESSSNFGCEADIYQFYLFPQVTPQTGQLTAPSFRSQTCLCLECLPHHPRLNSVCLIPSHPTMSSAYGFSINGQENNFFPPDMRSILFVLIHTTYHSCVLELFVSRRFLTPTTSRVLRAGQCPIYLLPPRQCCKNGHF